MAWVFLLAYACSGFAGLVYEVGWTRLLTLYIGHTTAATSAVVAAFLGGLAVGSAAGGRIASRVTPRRSLFTYIGLELLVALLALVLPLETRAATPLLRWAYDNGAPGLLFPFIRLISTLAIVFVPALALGATFPLAIRWFAREASRQASLGGLLYAVNTAGAALGAVAAGFLLIPAIGLTATIGVGVAASASAAGLAALAARAEAQTPPVEQPTAPPDRGRRSKAKNPRSTRTDLLQASPSPVLDRWWIAPAVLGISGFGALANEIAWTRILVLIVGPTTYAIASALAAVIAGVALGAAVGSWLVARSSRPAAWLALTLAIAAAVVGWTCSIAGGEIAHRAVAQLASSSGGFREWVLQGVGLAVALVFPTSLLLGAAFPLALALVADRSSSAAARFGAVYAVNTAGSVGGALAAGFVLIPGFGLQSTLRVVSACLVASAVIVIVLGRLTNATRAAAAVALAAAVAVLAGMAPWDRDLLASGAYLYARFVPGDVDVEAQLKAGTLLYYREGAAATVSVKRLTGTTTLAVDGKVDASNRSDMLTQKLLAHLPLLMHEHPRRVAVVGLGSGVTVGAALRHPIEHVDVVEISPEVVEASHFFDGDNGRPLDDPRTRLIVGDGRSHLLLSNDRYDAIISEPSNPWIAGVAALFTREFFEAVRGRLAPGGIVCQWAHTYSISDGDLRAIVGTFTSVFPNSALWLVGEDDVLLLASDRPLDERLANIARNWTRPGVGEDLRAVAAVNPFTVLSLFAAGPKELGRYAAGASILTDDRMRLEFSGPRALRLDSAVSNGRALAALLDAKDAPPVIRAALAAAAPADWRNRAAMMVRAEVYSRAYDDYTRVLTATPDDTVALDGFVRSATLSGRIPDAIAGLREAGTSRSTPALVAMSKLQAASGASTDALDSARRAAAIVPIRPDAVEQLASVQADGGDVAALDATVEMLRRLAPERVGTEYYAAVAALLNGRLEDAKSLAERAVAIDPNYAPVYDLLGAALLKLGRLDAAREAFQKSLAFDAHDSTAYTNLGFVELASGRRREAARYFAEALGLAPNSELARQGLAQAQ